jgi:ribosomal protein L7/L12
LRLRRCGHGYGAGAFVQRTSPGGGVLISVYNDIQLSSFVDQIFERLRALEAQMARVSDAAGVPYEAPSAGVPQEVIDLAQAGDRMGAIMKYRELTGFGLDQAKEVVAGL